PSSSVDGLTWPVSKTLSLASPFKDITIESILVSGYLKLSARTSPFVTWAPDLGWINSNLPFWLLQENTLKMRKSAVPIQKKLRLCLIYIILIFLINSLYRLHRWFVLN